MKERNRVAQMGHGKTHRHHRNRIEKRPVNHRLDAVLGEQTGFDYDIDKSPIPIGISGDQVVESVLQTEYDEQASYITIVVQDSAEVEILNSDFQAALSLQATLQLALAIILSVVIADEGTYNRVVNDIVTRIQEVQILRRVIKVENSYNVRVQVVATELAFNLQLLLQLMVSILAKLEVA